MLRDRLHHVLADLRKFGSLSSEDLARHQGAELAEAVRFHYANNSTYRALCDARGVTPEAIRRVEDVQRLPIVERDFLSKHGFFHGEGGALSVPFSDLGTFLNSSGSTGKPKRIPIAERAFLSIFETSAMGLWITGVHGHERPGGGPILPIFPHGPFPSSFFVQNGCEMIGFAAKADMGLPYEWHLRTLMELGAKYVVTSPSFLSAFAAFAAPRVDLRALGLERIVLGGEFFSEGFRRHMQERFGARVRDIYGCGESQVVAAESDVLHERFHGFLYHLAHRSIIEIVEPGTDRVLPPGERGEMVISVLNRRAWPVLRYRMGDIVAFHPDGAAARGIEHAFPLITRIQGRADDMLIYGNVNVFPETVFNALTAYEGARADAPRLSADKFRFVVDEDAEHRATATLTVELEPSDAPSPTAESIARSEAILVEALLRQSDELRHAVLVGKQVPAPRIDIVPPGSLYVKEQKLRRMIDGRRR